MKVSDYIVKYLKYSGVRYAYGCVGGAVTHIIDSICKEPGIDFFHCYHEQAAAFAASSSAKYSDELKVAIATSGPGATNFITGIADAYFDSAPVLFLSGQVNTYDFKYDRKVRQFGFQETDIVNIIKPITKYSVLLDRSECVEQELRKAVYMALSGRPGPVYIDIPLDVQRDEINPVKEGFTRVKIDSVEAIEKSDLEEIFGLLKNSKRPLALVGGGCRVAKARESLVQMAEKLSLPVVVSLMGKDCFPNDHPLFAGFIGAYGNRYGNIALAESDLLLVLGSRLDSRQIGNVLDLFEDKKIIQVDIDENEIGQRLEPEKSIICDARKFLNQFIIFLDDEKHLTNTDWLSFIGETKKLFPPMSELGRAGKKDFHYRVMNQISQSLGPDDVVCVDVGQNQMLAAQMIQIRGGQRFINSGGMAPMGYSLPASIPVALEYGKRAVVLTGDGGMQINIQELNGIAKHKLPVIIFVFDNHSLGMIKQFQELYFESRYCDVDENSGYYSADFAEIAAAYGINAARLNSKMPGWEETVSGMLISTDLPLLVHVELDYQTYIFPKLEFDKPVDQPDPKLTVEEEERLANLKRALK